MQLDQSQFYKGLKELGFGLKTGIDFPGESSGLLARPPWKPIKQATISYGHGIATTPLQQVYSLLSIINGGIQVTPKFVKKISQDTLKVTHVKTETRTSQFSSKTREDITKFMSKITAPGSTGVQAKVEGYSVGGKTGTAIKLVDGSYDKDEVIASFLGFYTNK